MNNTFFIKRPIIIRPVEIRITFLSPTGKVNLFVFIHDYSQVYPRCICSMDAEFAVFLTTVDYTIHKVSWWISPSGQLWIHRDNQQVGFCKTPEPICCTSDCSSSFHNPGMETAGLYTENGLYSQRVCINRKRSFLRRRTKKRNRGGKCKPWKG
jgi:hypothetical protein